MRVSPEGLKASSPSGRRMAAMTTSSAERMGVSLSIRPTKTEPSATSICSNPRSSDSAVSESMKSATAGLRSACAMRWLPMMVGATTRLAPALMSFGPACSSTARATMWSP
jgi:hypothetical protein